jgi:hypothetical protein
MEYTSKSPSHKYVVGYEPFGSWPLQVKDTLWSRLSERCIGREWARIQDLGEAIKLIYSLVPVTPDLGSVS